LPIHPVWASSVAELSTPNCGHLNPSAISHEYSSHHEMFSDDIGIANTPPSDQVSAIVSRATSLPTAE
jgi:hypothetical protein